MATTEFANLPAEIHVNIARHCEGNDLLNLCLTTRLINKRCTHVLYRHVDLELDRFGLSQREQMADACKRQQRFVQTLLSHPEYGKHVRLFKGTLCKPRPDFDPSLEQGVISDAQWWRAMESLTQVQGADLGSRNFFAYEMTVPTQQIPTDVFQSLTSVRLVGHMQHGLAKSILDVINPATLEHLCIDMLQDRKLGESRVSIIPVYRDEDRRIIERGPTSGLLTTLTGRCTALRTLILRRVGQGESGQGWQTAREEASYTEWASFIRSVQGTVEHFTFEQAGESLSDRFPFVGEVSRPVRVMDERFLRLIFPAIVSGNWPCLTTLELQGVRRLIGEVGKAALITELRDVLGEKPKIVVDELQRMMYLV